MISLRLWVPMNCKRFGVHHAEQVLPRSVSSSGTLESCRFSMGTTCNIFPSETPSEVMWKTSLTI